MLGATGFLGRRAAAALEADGIEVARVSRRGPVRVDLRDATTFEALSDCEVVLDLANATAACPEALAAWCVAEGKLFVEATSDAPVVEGMASRLAGRGPGLVVLGAGIFTGVSNLMARRVAEAVPGARRLSWAVASSPYSAAGTGTIELMVSASALPALRYEAGVPVESRLERGPLVAFEAGPLPTLRLRLAEASMLRASTGVPDVEVLFAPLPSLLVPAFALTPAPLFGAPWFGVLMRAAFIVLRRGLLSWRATTVRMVAEAESSAARRRILVRAQDGMQAAAFGAAAITGLLARARPGRSGVCFVDDVLVLDAVVREAERLAGRPVFEVQGPS